MSGEFKIIRTLAPNPRRKKKKAKARPRKKTKRKTARRKAPAPRNLAIRPYVIRMIFVDSGGGYSFRYWGGKSWTKSLNTAQKFATGPAAVTVARRINKRGEKDWVALDVLPA